MNINVIKRRVKLYKKLHGTTFTSEDIAKDICKEYTWNYTNVLYEVEKISNTKYGIFIGRCQPFHNGHNAVIQEIIRDNKTPIIILGSANVINERNPLHTFEREEIIKEIYPDINIITMKDYDNWDIWIQEITNSLNMMNIKKEDCTLYAHSKPGDIYDFEYNGREYFNEPYTIIFEYQDYEIKNLDEYCCSLGMTIHASDIRQSEEIAKRNIDARTYIKLKNKNFWKEQK